MKIEKIDDKTIKITAPTGSKIGGNLTPDQLLADLAKYQASPGASKSIQPQCAVCISN
jgi:hypothetical protein